MKEVCLIVLLALPFAARASDPRWYAVPNVAFDSDDGLGFGARGELAFLEPGVEPYAMAYVLHLFFSDRGYMHHRLRLDRVGFGPDQRLRLTAHFAWRQWLNDGYYGLGDRTVRDRAYAAELPSEAPERKRYRYTLRQPFAHVTLRGKVAGRWSVFGALSAKWSSVVAYPGSLLEAEQPFGTSGGPSLQLFLGILFDTRRPEVSPERGVLLELSGRAVPQISSSTGQFVGVFASARAYLSLGDRVVLAARLMGELLAGDVPFFELVHFGGSEPIAGFGGSETLRGVPFGRWRAPGKAVLNTEARIRVLSHTLFGDPFAWLVVPYFDAGAVFGGVETGDGRGGAPIHPAAGLGIRAVYNEVFVGRVDAGLGLDAVREVDGSITTEPNFGLYIVFDHPF